jgi:phosphohistidine phosphatase
MVKQLYLVRHAEALAKSAHQPDKERQLTTAGVQQVLQAGTYLQRENLALDAIFSSTAERAKQTASIVADIIKLDTQRVFFEDDLYDASARTFFSFIGKLDNGYNHVMCVGHNPTISYVAEYLSKAEIGDMATAGIAIISFNISSWTEVGQGNGELLRYLTPREMVHTGSQS